MNSDAGKEFVYALENVVRDFNLSHSGSEVHNVCPKWFGESSLEISDGSVQLRGADGRKFQDYGKRKIWLQIGNHLRQWDLRVVEVTQPIISVTSVCENGTETHLARELFLKYGDRRNT